MIFIIQQILFYISIFFILFVPGYFFILAIFGKKNKFSQIENLAISFGSSLILSTFLIILIGKIGIPIDKISIISSTMLLSLVCYSIYRFNGSKEEPIKNPIRFNKKQAILIILILFLTIFIKSAYLKNSIFPTSTDLGHHMYWAKLVSESGSLPDYKEIEIIEKDSNYVLETNPIADFIIGEHLIFSAINILSGINFISYFPTLVLFLIDIMGILAFFALALRLFPDDPQKNIGAIKNGTNIAIFSLFILGPIYAISSPQAKFISGGVIGNLIGNLLIPISLYFFLRALKEKDSRMIFMALFTSAGMAYMHHLSSLIFLFIFIFIFISFFVLLALSEILVSQKNTLKNIFFTPLNTMLGYFKLILDPKNLIFLVLFAIMVTFIYTPTYLNADATATALGAPSKSTRTGLSLTQFKYAVGEPRLAIGIIGILSMLVIIFRELLKTKKIDQAKILSLSLIVGWALAISIMSIKPDWLKVDIPSGRIANYANFSFIIPGAFFFIWTATILMNLKSKKYFLPKNIAIYFLAILFLNIVLSGFFDNSQSLSAEGGNRSALQTFHASQYLSYNLKQDELNQPDYMILKDHNYIKADAWIKLFFMKDMNFPLSRAYFKRYEDPTKPREMCTLWMIDSPTSEKAQKCYNDTQTRFIMVNSQIDSIQFNRSKGFWNIYSGEEVSIFYKY